jgi:hypothetical protein
MLDRLPLDSSCPWPAFADPADSPRTPQLTGRLSLPSIHAFAFRPASDTRLAFSSLAGAMQNC